MKKMLQSLNCLFTKTFFFSTEDYRFFKRKPQIIFAIQVFSEKCKNRNGYSSIQIIKSQKAEIPIPKIRRDINNEKIKIVN